MFGDPSPCSIKALVLDKALNEAHMNHMEYYNKILPRNERKPIGEEKTIQLTRLNIAITHELVVKQD